MQPSPLSIAILAPKSLLPNIRQGIEDLGHAVAISCDPSQISDGLNFAEMDLVFIALTPEVEDIYEQLEELLEHSVATLFDEAENKQAWPPSRWRQHLQSKLEKITRRQEPEKLLNALASSENHVAQQANFNSATANLPSDTEQTSDGDFAWDFVNLDAMVEPVPVETLPQPTQFVQDNTGPGSEQVLPMAPVFDGGFDFYGDEEPSSLGTVQEETATLHIEAPASYSTSPSEPHTPPPEEPIQPTPSGQEWDLSSLALLDDEALPSIALPAASPKETQAGPQWSLEGDPEPEASPVAEHDISIHDNTPEDEAPLTAEVTTSDVVAEIPKLSEASGLVLIGGGAGGPGALVQLIPSLPCNLPVPLVAYQPLPYGREEVFASNLQKHTGLAVQLVNLDQPLLPGTLSLLRDGQTVKQTEDGYRIGDGELKDAISTLGEDSALVVLSGAPGSWVLPAMDAVGSGALLLGQNPQSALESQTISTLREIGLETGEPDVLGKLLAERWGLPAA